MGEFNYNPTDPEPQDEALKRIMQDPDKSTDIRTESLDITEDDIKSLMTESEAFEGGDMTATAHRILKEQLPTAILSIAKIARTATNERTRLDAAKYIIDRNLGRLATEGTLPNDPLRKLTDRLTGVDDSI